MSIFIVDYKEQVKKLISETYEQADLISKEFELTTEKLVENLQGVLPCNAVDEHLVFEALSELNFTPKEDPNEPLKFFWYFKRK